jgi:hypothetical protein
LFADAIGILEFNCRTISEAELEAGLRERDDGMEGEGIAAEFESGDLFEPGAVRPTGGAGLAGHAAF